MIQYTHGVPSGKWTYYDGSGKKVVEAEFKNGKKSVLRLLDKNGDILEEAIYN